MRKPVLSALAFIVAVAPGAALAQERPGKIEVRRGRRVVITNVGTSAPTPAPPAGQSPEPDAPSTFVPVPPPVAATANTLRSATQLPYRLVVGGGAATTIVVSRMRGLTIMKGADGEFFAIRTSAAPTDDNAPFLGFSNAMTDLNSIPAVTSFSAATPAASGADALDEIVNYYPSGDRESWVTGIRVFRSVRYNAVYSGMDVLVTSRETSVHYRFVVAPGSDLRQIKLQFASASLDGQGNLLTGNVGGRRLAQGPPVATQSQVPIAARWEIAMSGSTASPHVDAYDTSRELVIDFDIVTAGMEQESGPGTTMFMPRGTVVALDEQQYLYVAGRFDKGIGVWKLTAAGDPIFSTYIAMFTAQRNLFAIRPDGNGDVYVAMTNPNLFKPVPVTRPSCTERCVGPYVIKLNGRGELVEAALASSPDNQATAIALTSKGAVYTGGSNLRPDLQLKDSCCAAGGLRGYLLEHDPLHRDGSEIVYGTFLADFYMPKAIHVDTSGIVYVAGEAGAPSGTLPAPLPGEAFQKSFGGGNSDGFVLKLDPARKGPASLLAATYFGGADESPFADELITDLAVDGAGNVYAAGRTTSPTLPASASAYQRDARGPSDGFVCKLDPDLKRLRWSTRLGGTDDDAVTALSVGADQNVYIGGWTKSQDFPKARAPEESETIPPDTPKAFLAKFNSVGRDLIESTIFGASEGMTDRFSIVTIPGSMMITEGIFGPAFSDLGVVGAQAEFPAMLATIRVNPAAGSVDPHIRAVSVKGPKVTIQGGNFDSGASVLVNDQVASVSSRSATEMVAVILQDVKGRLDVSVINADHKSATATAESSPLDVAFARLWHISFTTKVAAAVIAAIALIAAYVRRRR
jgi:hypothetical protein